MERDRALRASTLRVRRRSRLRRSQPGDRLGRPLKISGKRTDLRTVCAARTCLRTFAANLGSPLEATDFSRSVTFSKSWVDWQKRGGRVSEGTSASKWPRLGRASVRSSKPDPGAPNRLGTLPTSGYLRGTHHIQHVSRGDGRLILRSLFFILVRPVFHLHVRAHRGRRTSVSRYDVATTKTCANWFKRAPIGRPRGRS